MATSFSNDWTPLAPGHTGALATRGADERAKRRAARRAKRGQQPPAQPAQSTQPNAGILSAQDMLQLFQAMPTPNRGFKNPNASKPHVMGQGMDWLDKINTPDAVAARQTRTNSEHAQRRAQADQAGSAAVEYTKQTKGYTDANGKFVPPVNPIPPSSNYGTGSIKYYQPGEARPMATTTDPLTGKKVPLRSFLDDLKGVQATKYGPGMDENGNQLAGPSAAQAGQDYLNPKGAGFNAPKPPAPAAPTPAGTSAQDFAALFPGSPTPKPASPPSAPASSQTMMGQLPGFESSGMPLPSLPNDTPNAWGAQSRAASFPAGQMTSYTPPNSSPEQLSALSTLHQLFGNQGPASAGLESTWNNMFKGKNDWEYLQQLFPGAILPGQGNTTNMRNLQSMYQDPVYQSRF